MKQRIFFLIIVLTLTFFPALETNSSSQLSEEEREVLLQQYNEIKERLYYLRWYVQKFDLKEKIDAQSYLVVNLCDDSTLLRKDNESIYSIASITKLMSAVVAAENINADEKITLTTYMLGHNRESPALYLGSTVTAEDLIKASLIQSTNDASEALTYFLEKGEFVELMNEKAKEIGMKNTRFYDAHGLGRSYNTRVPNNVATAGDIAKLLFYISKNHPEILKITLDEKFQLPGRCPEHNWICTFLNRNIFHGITDFIGGKTGFLNAAGQTFAGIFESRDRQYAIILLKSTDRRSDTQKIWEWIKKKP